MPKLTLLPDNKVIEVENDKLILNKQNNYACRVNVIFVTTEFQTRFLEKHVCAEMEARSRRLSQIQRVAICYKDTGSRNWIAAGVTLCVLFDARNQ